MPRGVYMRRIDNGCRCRPGGCADCDTLLPRSRPLDSDPGDATTPGSQHLEQDVSRISDASHQWHCGTRRLSAIEDAAIPSRIASMESGWRLSKSPRPALLQVVRFDVPHWPVHAEGGMRSAAFMVVACRSGISSMRLSSVLLFNQRGDPSEECHCAHRVRTIRLLQRSACVRARTTSC